MDCLSKPDKLKILPEDPGASKVCEYWLKAFESFLFAVTSVTNNE